MELVFINIEKKQVVIYILGWLIIYSFVMVYPAYHGVSAFMEVHIAFQS
jgi:hypothetical protein